MKKNLCNLLTGVRVFFLAPLAMYLITRDNAVCVGASAIVILAAAISDGLDGFCARRFNAVSNFGRFFDIVADVVFMVSMFSALLAIGWLWLPALYVILVREVGVAYGRVLCAVEKGEVIDAKTWGKLKTASEFFCLIAVASAVAIEKSEMSLIATSVSKVLAQTMVIISLAMVVYSGVCYLRFFRSIFEE